MDEITMRDRPSGSVWGVAAFAVALFVAVVLLSGVFGAPDIVGATAPAVQ